MFSVLGGRPWSELLKGSSTRRIEEFAGREDLSFLILRGVLTKVMVQPLCFCISRDKARKGMIWPCAMNGNITIFCFFSITIDQDVCWLRIRNQSLVEDEQPELVFMLFFSGGSFIVTSWTSQRGNV